MAEHYPSEQSEYGIHQFIYTVDNFETNYCHWPRIGMMWRSLQQSKKVIFQFITTGAWYPWSSKASYQYNIPHNFFITGTEFVIAAEFH